MITIALSGNPNSGKTTFFNEFTGSRQHIANYPGITVEKKDAMIRIGNDTIRMIDLPGTYSITAYSEEERAVSNSLFTEKLTLLLMLSTHRLLNVVFIWQCSFWKRASRLSCL